MFRALCRLPASYEYGSRSIPKQTAKSFACFALCTLRKNPPDENIVATKPTRIPQRQETQRGLSFVHSRAQYTNTCGPAFRSWVFGFGSCGEKGFQLHSVACHESTDFRGGQTNGETDRLQIPTCSQTLVCRTRSATVCCHIATQGSKSKSNPRTQGW